MANASAAVALPVSGNRLEPDLVRALHLGRRGSAWRWLRRAAWALGVMAIVALGVGWWLRARAPTVVHYVTEPVVRGDLVVTVTATGTLEPRNVVDVGSEVSGRISRVLVDFNNPVTKGQVLAEVDPELFAAQLAQSRAQVQRGDAQLVQSLATLRETALGKQRADQLFPEGAISAQERDAASAASERAAAAVSLARAEQAQARAALRIATTNLTRCVIRSPMDGVVLARSIEPGQTVVAAFQAPVLFQVAEDLAHMKVSIDIDEADIGLVEPGQQATFTVAAFAGRDFPARLVSVHNAARVVDRVVSYEADLEVDNRDLVLRPGMTVTTTLIAKRVTDALSVPSKALRYAPRHATDGADRGAAGAGAKEAPRVWILDHGKPSPIEVEPGASNDTRTVIRSDKLTPGALIVVDEK